MKLGLQVGTRIFFGEDGELRKDIDEMQLAAEPGKKVDSFREGGTNMKNGYSLPVIEMFEQ